MRIIQKAIEVHLTEAALGLLLILAGCAGGGGDRRPYLERLQVDLGEAARGFSDGRLTSRQYLALAADRTDKARLYQEDSAWRLAAAGGDRDGDGVPDSTDACKDTPRLTATDRRGCPLPTPPNCPPTDPLCPRPDGDRRTRDLQDEVSFLIDPKCDGSPIPQTPQPLEWGGVITPPPAGPGGGAFNLAVTRVDNQKPGCTLFYEMQIRISLLPVQTFNVLFNAREDLSPGNSRRAVFPLPLNATLPPQRTALRDRLQILNHVAATLQWRVRAVNGNEEASSWSTPRILGQSPHGVMP